MQKIIADAHRIVYFLSKTLNHQYYEAERSLEV